MLHAQQASDRHLRSGIEKEASVAAVLPHLNELTADLFAVLARTKGSGLTEQLAEKDKARDAAFEDVLKLKTEAEASDNVPPMGDCRRRMARYLKPLLSYL